MPATLTVAYPAEAGETFDQDYYAATHLPLVREVMGPLGLEAVSASRGVATAADRPSPYHAVAYMIFSDVDALRAALDGSERVLADIPNYYSGRPVMMVGETIA